MLRLKMHRLLDRWITFDNIDNIGQAPFNWQYTITHLASNISRKDIPQSLKEITMTLPRKQLVAVEDTPYYHVVSRCVRRSYLCGIDVYSSKDYGLFLLLHQQ